jgi:hypothetical protein
MTEYDWETFPEKSTSSCAIGLKSAKHLMPTKLTHKKAFLDYGLHSLFNFIAPYLITFEIYMHNQRTLKLKHCIKFYHNLIKIRPLIAPGLVMSRIAKPRTIKGRILIRLVLSLKEQDVF